MVGFPHGKINLGLCVTRKREDGFHDLETLFYPLPWHDVLEIVRGDEFRITVTGSGEEIDPEANLCSRAYRLMERHVQLPPVHIHLHKSIPSGGGLGGGSSDGAATLQLLNQKFTLGFSSQSLQAMALELGSDCPYFLTTGAQIGRGRGEILQPFPLSLTGYTLLLLNPGIHISTREAFSGIVPQLPPMPMEKVLRLPVEEWRGKLVNDFTKTVYPLHPELPALEAKLYERGALYASLSGTGATVYGIFRRENCPSGEIFGVSVAKRFDV